MGSFGGETIIITGDECVVGFLVLCRVEVGVGIDVVRGVLFAMLLLKTAVTAVSFACCWGE